MEMDFPEKITHKLNDLSELKLKNKIFKYKTLEIYF